MRFSRARLQKLIIDGAVRVNGEPVKPATRLQTGATVSVEFPSVTPTALVPESVPLNVLYEDSDLIAVDKEAGVAVHPGLGHPSGTLVHALLAHCEDLSGIGGVERPGIVHRLDKDTSGVVVVAKNDFAHERLSSQFAQRSVHKLYRAFVLGAPPVSEMRIETLIGRHPTQRKRFSSRVSHGKRAVTRYRAVTIGDISELEVEIETGRTHQIRVHLSDSGLPIVGDALYGGRRWSRIGDLRAREIARGQSRQALHAERLEISHPRSAQRLVFQAELPADLKGLRKALRT